MKSSTALNFRGHYFKRVERVDTPGPDPVMARRNLPARTAMASSSTFGTMRQGPCGSSAPKIMSARSPARESIIQQPIPGGPGPSVPSGGNGRETPGIPITASPSITSSSVSTTATTPVPMNRMASVPTVSPLPVGPRARVEPTVPTAASGRSVRVLPPHCSPSPRS